MKVSRAADSRQCKQKISKKLLAQEKVKCVSVYETRQSPEATKTELLVELVSVVEQVLAAQPVQVWQVFGGFERVYEAVYRIVSHGCSHSTQQGEPDIWPFVVGLRVIRPALGPCMNMTTTPHPAHDWIRTSLRKLDLAAKLSALTTDQEYVREHYHPWALLLSQDHTLSVITCLQALEDNSPTRLADIDSRLIVKLHQSPEGCENITSGLVRQGQTSLVASDTGLRHCVRQVHHQPFCAVSRGWSADSGITYNHRKDFTKASVQKCDGGAICHCSHSMAAVTEGDGPSVVSLEKISDPAQVQSDNIAAPRSGASPQSTNSQLCKDDLPSRESPDGSSDTSEWLSACPISLPSAAGGEGGSKFTCHSPPSTVSMLVQGSHVTHDLLRHTGARPKEHINPPVKEVSDASESGTEDPRFSAAPSLLLVSYGREQTSGDGDSGPASTSSQKTRGCVSAVPRTPQARHRAPSTRLSSAARDSDQDSEDLLDGSQPQVSRRRRRPHSGQHHTSVKSLIDSRGVLPQQPDQSTHKTKASHHHPTHAAPPEVLQDTHGAAGTCDNPGVSAQAAVPHEISAPVATTSIPPTAVECSLAFSAPEGSRQTPSQLSLPRKSSHSRSRSDGSQDLVDKAQLSQSKTAPVLAKHEGQTRMVAELGSGLPKSFMEDGGHSITPAADNGFFPMPQPGQSLIGFLSSKAFHKQNAALDRENAHFSISEAVIAALAQMQFEAWYQRVGSSSGTAEGIDEEIRSLEALIREKRMQKLSGTVLPPAASPLSLPPPPLRSQSWPHGSSSKLESTTDYSVYESPQSSASNGDTDAGSEGEEEVGQEAASTVLQGSTELQQRSVEMSQGSYSSDQTSAEVVAINLLKHFNEQKLPKASELEWLVSEKDVPQKLLPLPTSVAVSPDDGGPDRQGQNQPQLRGTSDWAPPRPQLILTLHTKTKRSVLMGRQGWRCAGCGMRVSEQLSHHFRLCCYLGRYFCTTCHSNQTHIIPAYIIHKWDFKEYPVANFSLELIQRMRNDPLFNVGALNPGLYKRVRHLYQTRIYRLQLYHTRSYVTTCNRAHRERQLLGNRPAHWANDPHLYSLDDLLAIKDRSLVAEMKNITTICINHVAKCEVCIGRGFICEVCMRGEPIFPFQLDSTAMCGQCGACFHTVCYSPLRCPRCIRRETRRVSQDHLELVT